MSKVMCARWFIVFVREWVYLNWHVMGGICSVALYASVEEEVCCLLLLDGSQKPSNTTIVSVLRKLDIFINVLI